MMFDTAVKGFFWQMGLFTLALGKIFRLSTSPKILKKFKITDNGNIQQIFEFFNIEVYFFSMNLLIVFSDTADKGKL